MSIQAVVEAVTKEFYVIRFLQWSSRHNIIVCKNSFTDILSDKFKLEHDRPLLERLAKLLKMKKKNMKDDDSESETGESSNDEDDKNETKESLKTDVPFVGKPFVQNAVRICPSGGYWR